MALKLDNRPGQVYDPEDSGSKSQPDGSHDVGAISPGEQAKFDQIEAGERDLGSLEKNASSNDGQTSATNSAEAPLQENTDDTVGRGYTKKTKKTTIGRLTKKQVGIGGGVFGIGAIIVTILMGVTSSLYLIGIKEGLTGESNKVSNTISIFMQKRRLSTFGHIIQKGAQNLQTEKLSAKLTKEGFEVVTEKGAIRSIKKVTANGTAELVFDGSNKSLVKQVNGLNQSVVGREFMQSFDDVAKERISRFAGVVTRKKVYQRLGITALIDWIGAYRVRVGPDIADKTQPRALVSQTFIHSDETIKDVVANLGPNDVKPGDLGPGTTVDDIGKTITDQANALRDEALEGTGEKITVAGEEQAGKVAAEIADTSALLASASTNEATEASAESLAKKIGGKIGSGLLKVVAGSFDVSTLTREGCRTKGTLQFIKNVRNTLMAVELAKFTLKFYTIADHQKAGLIQASSVKLMALYLAGSTGSGGMQWALNAGKGTVAVQGLSKYGVGYADVGILAAISTFLGSLPTLDFASCKFVNNPLTQIGGTLAGGLLAVFTFGGSSLVNLGWSIGLTVANEVAFAVGTPLLLRTASGLVVDGWESAFDAGDALAAGDGVLKMQTAGANAGLPVSNDVFALQSNEATFAYQEKLANNSIFDRYLNVAKTDSLLSRLSISLPLSFSQLGSGMRDFLTTSIPNSTKIVSNTLNPFDNQQAYAIGSDQCTDPAALEFNIATDPFCSPILSYVPVLDIDQTESVLLRNDLIDGQGEPIGEFADFVKNCFSGRTGILHPEEVSKYGESEENDPTCVVGVKDNTLDGDVREEFAGYNAPDTRNWVQKFFTPSASAATPTIERVPTKKERFAVWYGYLVDRENLTTQINDELAEIGFDEPQLVNSNVFVLGDSLTVGMQNLAGTDNGGGNYLQRELTAKGWNATVDAQGCRSVYQSAGAIIGDGSSCPKQTIIDGISTISNPTNLKSVQSSGTFVIALGTNGGETGGVAGAESTTVFRQKAIELIDLIKQFNPSANIYWLNLHFRSESTREIERNKVINDLISQKGIKLMDWDARVNTLANNGDLADDVTFADTVHHDANGYKIKTSFLVNALGSPSPNINDTTIVTGQRTDNIPCAAGVDMGVVDGYEKGVLTKIRICNVQGTKVNSQISSNIDKMFTEASAAGLDLSGGEGYRTMATQQNGWDTRCGMSYPETSKWAIPPCSGAQLARPGYSNHQMGFAIDIICNNSGAVIASTTDPCFLWLEKNAARFGMYEWGNNEQLPVSPKRGKGGYEPWHWSINGS